jgi:hypothetical protein
LKDTWNLLSYKAVWAHQGIGVSGSIARTIAVPDTAPQRARLFVGKAKSYSRVTMNIIASSETIAVRLQKTCIVSPGHYSGAAAARSPV